MPLLESSLEIRQWVHAGLHPELAESLDYLAELDRAEKYFAAADSRYRAALYREDPGPQE